MKVARNMMDRAVDADDRRVLAAFVVLAAGAATVVVGGAGLAGLAVRVFGAAVG